MVYSLHFGYLQDSEYVSFVLVELCHNLIFDFFFIITGISAESFGREKRIARNEVFLKNTRKLYQGGLIPNVNKFYFEQANVEYLRNQDEHHPMAMNCVD
jgi:hypothetical protein